MASDILFPRRSGRKISVALQHPQEAFADTRNLWLKIPRPRIQSCRGFCRDWWLIAYTSSIWIISTLQHIHRELWTNAQMFLQQRAWYNRLLGLLWRLSPVISIWRLLLENETAGITVIRVKGMLPSNTNIKFDRATFESVRWRKSESILHQPSGFRISHERAKAIILIPATCCGRRPGSSCLLEYWWLQLACWIIYCSKCSAHYLSASPHLGIMSFLTEWADNVTLWGPVLS